MDNKVNEEAIARQKANVLTISGEMRSSVPACVSWRTGLQTLYSFLCFFCSLCNPDVHD